MDHRNRVYKSNEERVHEGISEHLDIVERMLAKDYEGASKCLFNHIKSAKNYAMKKYIG